MRLKSFVPDQLISCGHHLLIVFVALFAGNAIVMQRTTLTWQYLQHKPFFYISVLGSSLVAFALIHYVRLVTIWINKKESGFYVNNDRIAMQFKYGFLGGVLLAVFLTIILYMANQENILSGTYFSKLFIIVVLFIAILNFTYALYHFRNSTSIPVFILVEPPEPKVIIRYKFLNPKPEPKPIDTVVLDLEVAPALIYLAGKSPQAMDARGGYIKWDYTMSASSKILPAEDYFGIDRGFIIHRHFISEIKNDETGLTIVPAHKINFNLKVSRRNDGGFRTWFAGDHQDPTASDD